MKIETAVTALAALAQETRLSLFRLLVQAGAAGMAAGTIGERLDIPLTTLSFHLKTLSHAGLIQSRTEGRFVIYSANYAEMNKLLTYLTEHCCAGDASQCPPTHPC